MVFTQPAVERVLRARVAELPQRDGGARRRRCNGIDAGRERRVARRSTPRTANARRCAPATRSPATAAQARCARSSTCRWRTSTSTSPGWWWTCWSTTRASPSCRQVSVQYCEPERPCTLVIGPKNHRRWEISLKPGEDPLRGGARRRDLEAARALAHARGRRRCGARPAIASTRWWPPNGARAACSWPAMRRTCSRPSSGRACARASAMRPT